MIIAACRGETPGCIPGLGKLGAGACYEWDELGNCTSYYSDSPTVGLGPVQNVAPTIVAPANNAPSWWQNILGGAFKTTEQILVAKNQPKGVLTQTAPGQFTYTQPEGSQVTLPVNVSPVGSLTAATSPGMGLILAGGVALLVVMMMARKS